jgi:hypothetical protein
VKEGGEIGEGRREGKKGMRKERTRGRKKEKR